ncbi:hypothetical protein LINGRAHAP2_LOCUS7624 [Linum grandiflorum]
MDGDFLPFDGLSTRSEVMSGSKTTMEERYYRRPTLLRLRPRLPMSSRLLFAGSLSSNTENEGI